MSRIRRSREEEARRVPSQLCWRLGRGRSSRGQILGVGMATGSKIGRKDDRYVFNFYFRLLVELELEFDDLFEFLRYLIFFSVLNGCRPVVPQ
jgi:hypothetical protein